MFLKNRNISSKIKRSKVTDYAALKYTRLCTADGTPSQNIRFLTFDNDLGVNVTRDVVQYSLQNMAYVPAKFEGATSNGLESMHLQEKHYLTFDDLWVIVL